MIKSIKNLDQMVLMGLLFILSASFIFAQIEESEITLKPMLVEYKFNTITRTIPQYKIIYTNYTYLCYDNISSWKNCSYLVPQQVIDKMVDVVEKPVYEGVKVDGRLLEYPSYIDDVKKKAYIWHYPIHIKIDAPCRAYEKEKGVCDEIDI